MGQYRGISGNGHDQFRAAERYVILYPPEFKTGEFVVPYQPEN